MRHRGSYETTRAAKPPAVVSARAKVLIVDDEPINLAMIGGLLRRDFDVVHAATGAEAVTCAAAGDIDVVVMDIHLPGMTGVEATQLIKAGAGDRVLPVILMTASNEETQLSEGLARGADDFLLKPVSRTLLIAKVNTLLRAARAFRVLRERNRELAELRADAERDYEIALGVFDRVTKPSRFDLPDLVVDGFSLEAFNGDVVLSAVAGHSLRLLVGDFAGHGLGAAVGALPASEVFFAMSRQGFSLGDLARELGAKLHRMFPRELFLAACLIDVDLQAGRLQIWNAGLPDVLVFGEDGALAARVASGRPPLGVLPGPEVDRSVVQVDFPLGARVAVFSDGLPEARADDGSMFGMDRVEAALTGGPGLADWVAPLRDAHAAFRGPRSADDDVTFVGLTHSHALAAALASERRDRAEARPSKMFALQARFDPARLRQARPLDPLLDLLRTNLFGDRGADAQVVLTELFSNAMEHGLLELDSTIKERDDGFALYYRLRDQRLAALMSGLITVSVSVAKRCSGRAIHIAVSDSGRGFSPCETPPSPTPCSRAGRGLRLVRALVEELEIREGGTTVEAVLALSEASAP